MSKPPTPVSGGPTSRAEKLSVLSALLGPDAMARIRDAQPPGASEPKVDPVTVDADRVAWHRNRLLERLRQQGAGEGPAPHSAPAATRSEIPGSQQAFAQPSQSLDARLVKFSDAATLGQEHPAIIARLIKTLPRDERVEALKSLPGPMARLILRRLR